MAEIHSADFRQQYQGISDFLSNKNKVAFTDNHKFIFGQGKEMNHTELLKKLENLASALSEKNSTLSAKTKEQIAPVVSEMYQITNAKLNKKIPSSKSPKVLQTRIKTIENLAQKLGIFLQPLSSKDDNIIMRREWLEPQNPRDVNSPMRQFTLQRFANTKMQFISEEKESVNKINLSQRTSDASRVTASQGSSASSRSSSSTSLSSLDSTNTSSSKSIMRGFSVNSLETIKGHLTQALTFDDKKTLIGQLHQNFYNSNNSKEPRSESFKSQISDLAAAFDVQNHGDDLDKAATEVISKLIYNKSSPTTLFTSLNVVARDIKFPNDKESYLQADAEIVREGGQPQIALRLHGTIPSQFVSNNKDFKKVDTNVFVEYDPITGKHTETLTFQ